MTVILSQFHHCDCQMCKRLNFGTFFKFPCSLRIYAWFFMHCRNHHSVSYAYHVIMARNILIPYFIYLIFTSQIVFYFCQVLLYSVPSYWSIPKVHRRSIDSFYSNRILKATYVDKPTLHIKPHCKSISMFYHRDILPLPDRQVWHTILL